MISHPKTNFNFKSSDRLLEKTMRNIYDRKNFVILKDNRNNIASRLTKPIPLLLTLLRNLCFSPTVLQPC